MIRLQGIKKSIQGKLILDTIDFRLLPCQIVGFLGPNGAGKTTTFRIITQYLLPDKGHVFIQDLDTTLYPLQTRQMVGYLPENPCMYPEMTVRDYLIFIAKIKHIKPNQLKTHYPAIIAKTNLQVVEDQIICRLSKGYRKRVALAQALLGHPPVLILDEPFTGLDSFQMADTRNLIRELASNQTILLSSHLLAEVDQLCTHLIFIDKGRIITSGPTCQISTLFMQSLKFKLTITPLTPDIITQLQSHPQILKLDILSAHEPAQIELETAKKETIQQEIAQIIQSHQALIIEFVPVTNRLEDTYLQLLR